jgi:hypothetical protein
LAADFKTTNDTEMILINDILVSDSVVSEQFVCHLDRCKGACCVGGDYGAPIENDEIPILEELFEKIKPFMSDSGIKAVEEKGVFERFDNNRFKGVTLREDAACAFVRIDEGGIAHCTIEEAWNAGATDFRKPISCHLYPIRVRKARKNSHEALNYDVWELCSPACVNGKALKMPLYRFLREAITRKYGEEFYQILDRTARDLYPELDQNQDSD